MAPSARRPRASALPVRLLLALLALLVAVPVDAGEDEATTLARLGHAQRYTIPTTAPENPIDTGGAAILIHAPIETVRPIITGYGQYKKYVPTFEQSRLIGKKDGESEVYFDVPVLNGAAHIWAVVRMAKPKATPEGEVITGRLVKGNVEDFRTIWRLRKVDDKTTIAKLELLVDPEIPLPASFVTHHLQEAAVKGVTAIRKEAEKRAGYVAPSATPASPPSTSPVAAPTDEPSPSDEKRTNIAQR